MKNQVKQITFSNLKSCINPFHGADINWRFSLLCQYILQSQYLPKIPLKPQSQIRYITLTGEGYQTMTRLSLWSLGINASYLPQLIIVHEDTSSPEEIRSWLDFWPYEFQIYSQSEVANHYRQNNHEIYANYIDSHIFGLKFLASLLFCKNHELIYSDVDVLWFKDINQLADKYRQKKGSPWPAHDYNHSYNSYLIEKFPDVFYHNLNNFPPANAGFVYHNNLTDDKDSSPEYWLKLAVTATLSEVPVNGFSEQLIVAHLSVDNGGIMDIDDVCVNVHPKTRLCPSFVNQPWFARHYVTTIRRQFWIDALYLTQKLLLAHKY